jgi:ABC-type nickel/cobalt efflux system permease component RcnA
MNLEFLVDGAFCVMVMMLGIFISLLLAVTTILVLKEFIEEVKSWQQQKKD